MRPARLSRLLQGSWRPFATIAFVAIAWWYVAARGVVNPLFIPGPEAVFSAGERLLFEVGLYRDAWRTMQRALLGLFISILGAVPLGLVFGRMATLYSFVEFPVDFFRSIPSSALFFLFILGFGVGDGSKVAVVVYGCALILLVGAVYGARPTREKQDRIRMLEAFGATKTQILWLAVLRDALPQIAASVRVAVSLALVLVVVTEMFLGSNDGLGHRLYDYYLAYRVPEMYCVLLILGVLGFMTNKAAVLLERRLAFWVPQV